MRRKCDRHSPRRAKSEWTLTAAVCSPMLICFPWSVLWSLRSSDSSEHWTRILPAKLPSKSLIGRHSLTARVSSPLARERATRLLAARVSIRCEAHSDTSWTAPNGILIVACRVLGFSKVSSTGSWPFLAFAAEIWEGRADICEKTESSLDGCI